MDIWSIFIDGLWIVVLSLMSSASLGASRRAPKGVPLHMLGLPLPRLLALSLLPLLSLAAGLALIFQAETAGAESGLLNVGLRLALPPLLAVIHLGWLRAAMKRLQDEGRIQG